MLNRVGKESLVVRRMFFPSMVKIPVKVSTFVHVRVAICEPVEVDDDDEIFGR